MLQGPDPQYEALKASHIYPLTQRMYLRNSLLSQIAREAGNANDAMVQETLTALAADPNESVDDRSVSQLAL